MKELSNKQQRIIKFIDRFLVDKGYPPTIRDIQAGCGISSTSVVDYNLNILENKGYLSRKADISRGIRMLTSTFRLEKPVSVPIIGQIAAGEPIPVPTPDTWSVEAVSESLGVPYELTRGKEGIYALRVKGMSMVDALINDGDIVLMQYVNSVENGETAAVWLKAEKEATMKKVYIESDRIRLQPANNQMKPIYTTPENIEIQGRVVAVLRQVD